MQIAALLFNKVNVQDFTKKIELYKSDINPTKEVVNDLIARCSVDICNIVVVLK